MIVVKVYNEVTCVYFGLGKVFGMHKKSFSKTGVKSIGGYDINAEKAAEKKSLAEKAGEEFKVFKSIEDAIDAKPTFYDVAVSTNSHYDVVDKILTRNPYASIILEKPICNLDQIDLLNKHKRHFPQIVVNEVYRSSEISKKVAEILNNHGLIPKEIICEQSKHRGNDFAQGRFIDTSLFVWGYEVPHMLSLISGIDKQYLPGIVTESVINDASVKMPNGNTEVFGKQGSGYVRYKSKEGIEVILSTSMDGQVTFPKPQLSNEKIREYLFDLDPSDPRQILSKADIPQEHISQDDPETRYRMFSFNCKDSTEVVGLCEPIRGIERFIGMVAVLKNNRIIGLEGPIDDRTMEQHLKSAVEYLTGKSKKNPGDAETSIDLVKILHEIVSNAEKPFSSKKQEAL